MRKSLLALIVGIIPATALAQSGTPALPPATFADVHYGPHERHVLDYWRPTTSAPTPLLIFIHGGGWAGGDKRDLPAKLLRHMLDHGIAVASINYRYSTTAILPAPVHDAARAVQFLRTKSAEWKSDPQRVGAYGISAGATTALWLAYHDDLADPENADPIMRQSTRLRAAVGLSPQTSLEPQIIAEWIGEQVLRHPMVMRAVGAKSLAEINPPSAEGARLLREFSALTHVTADDPSVLISNPRVDPLPATTPGNAIHHAIFGRKLKEKADTVGARCVLRLQDQPDATPEPEVFVVEELTK